MIDRAHDLPVVGQASLLQVSRSSVYSLPRPVPPARLAVMHRIDALHLEHPFAGSRMRRDLLRAEGVVIGRVAVATLMRRMGIEALYRRPNTSKPAPGHKIYPYLLRDLVIDRPNQVWAMDITYIPMARGFVHLAAVLDWFSRRVLAWRLSITLEVEFCLDAVQEALARHGKPEIFNTDQGSQFTSAAFTGMLQDQAIRISMDGRGAWRDNVFVERLWRSVKYEEVYLRAYDSVRDARASLGRYLAFYNGRRPHSSLGARTPEQAYLDHLPHQVQHDNAIGAVALLRSGYTLAARGHGAGKTCLSTGREVTYRGRNAVARNRATSVFSGSPLRAAATAGSMRDSAS
jgi:putative transposase